MPARRARERARDIVEAAAAEGSGDFVEQVSCELPLQAIAGLMGVPQEDRKKLFDWSNQMVGDQDPEFASNDPTAASVELIMYGMQMAAERGANPGDDLVTKLVQADVEGHRLSDDEFGFFVILLAVAGNETTRNSITQGMMAFTEFPDQWELFKKERPATAADEIVRWATPVTSFQRTALEDTELSGVKIKKGERVVMFYRSANFDEDVFDDPYTFNISARSQPARGVWRHRRALLHRREPGADDDRPDLQRDRRRDARPHADLAAGAAAVGLAQRHQALAGRLSWARRSSAVAQ